MPQLQFRFLLLLALLLPLPLSAASFDLDLPSGTAMPIHQFGERGDRLLWLPSEYGIEGPAELKLGQAVAATGLQVWMADLHSAYFIPPGRRSLFEMPPEEVAELILAALPEQGRLYLLGYGRSAALALLALREAQRGGELDGRFGGAVLLHPNLLAHTPEPGKPADYLPITASSNLPLYILQPGNSSQRWYLPEMVAQLESGGSEVTVQLLPGVSEGFHVRPDGSEAELAMRDRLPSLVRQALRLLAPYHHQARAALPMDERFDWSVESFAGMQPYVGNPEPPPLHLADLDGHRQELSEHRGEVVLLNFWATWCPPCVEELPSLVRLQEQLAGRRFRILGVAVGEQADTVRRFFADNDTALPTLLDGDGAAFKAWYLRAVPSTFLIDADGAIRYSYFGALAWDDDTVVDLIETLLDEAEAARMAGTEQ